MKKIYMQADDCTESFMLTVSSSATIDNFHETFTAETGGNCLGPADYEDSLPEVSYILENWGKMKEMPPEEAAERIAHLADEWGLNPGELQFLS